MTYTSVRFPLIETVNFLLLMKTFLYFDRKRTGLLFDVKLLHYVDGNLPSLVHALNDVLPNNRGRLQTLRKFMTAEYVLRFGNEYGGQTQVLT